MNKKEFAVFAAALRTYYPKENVLPNDKAMDLWFKELCDIPQQVADASLRKWVATNKWSPTIADIRETAISIQFGDVLDWGEAWEHVYTSCQRYGRNRASEVMESFDDITREAVKQIGGFTYICGSENIAADRARFEKVYNSIVKRKMMDMQIANPLKQLIANIQTQNLMIEKKVDEDESHCIS